MKLQWKRLIFCLGVPLAVGGLAAFVTRGEMKSFETLNKPPFSPPGWLFPVVWTALYLLMGFASYLVLIRKSQNTSALKIYALQLFFNFMWPIIFFSIKAYFFALAWLAALLVLVIMTSVFFSEISKTASKLLIPYVIWTAFAFCLNLGIALLN